MGTSAELLDMISFIEQLPSQLKNELKKMDDAILNSSLRESGWTVKQIIHHIAEGQMMFYYRMKWILAEDQPTLMLFDPDNWAKSIDHSISHVDSSLNILKGLCARLVDLVRNFEGSSWDRTANHPESGIITFKDIFIAFYDHLFVHLNQIKKMKIEDGNRWSTVRSAREE